MLRALTVTFVLYLDAAMLGMLVREKQLLSKKTNYRHQLLMGEF